jgi:hypothetical protein
VCGRVSLSQEATNKQREKQNQQLEKKRKKKEKNQFHAMCIYPCFFSSFAFCV